MSALQSLQDAIAATDQLLQGGSILVTEKCPAQLKPCNPEKLDAETGGLVSCPMPSETMFVTGTGDVCYPKAVLDAWQNQDMKEWKRIEGKDLPELAKEARDAAQALVKQRPDLARAALRALAEEDSGVETASLYDLKPFLASIDESFLSQWAAELHAYSLWMLLLNTEQAPFGVEVHIALASTIAHLAVVTSSDAVQKRREFQRAIDTLEALLQFGDTPTVDNQTSVSAEALAFLPIPFRNAMGASANAIERLQSFIVFYIGCCILELLQQKPMSFTPSMFAAVRLAYNAVRAQRQAYDELVRKESSQEALNAALLKKINADKEYIQKCRQLSQFLQSAVWSEPTDVYQYLDRQTDAVYRECIPVLQALTTKVFTAQLDAFYSNADVESTDLQSLDLQTLERQEEAEVGAVELMCKATVDGKQTFLGTNADHTLPTSDAYLIAQSTIQSIAEQFKKGNVQPALDFLASETSEKIVYVLGSCEPLNREGYAFIRTHGFLTYGKPFDDVVDSLLPPEGRERRHIATGDDGTGLLREERDLYSKLLILFHGLSAGSVDKLADIVLEQSVVLNMDGFSMLSKFQSYGLRLGGGTSGTAAAKPDVPTLKVSKCPTRIIEDGQEKQFVKIKSYLSECAAEAGYLIAANDGYCYPKHAQCLQKKEEDTVETARLYQMYARLFNRIQELQAKEELEKHIEDLKHEFPGQPMEQLHSAAEAKLSPAVRHRLQRNVTVLAASTLSKEAQYQYANRDSDVDSADAIEQLITLMRKYNLFALDWKSDDPEDETVRLRAKAGAIFAESNQCARLTVDARTGETPSAANEKIVEIASVVQESCSIQSIGDKKILVPSLVSVEASDPLLEWWKDLYAKRKAAKEAEARKTSKALQD
jgi:hypothetical protein